MFITIYSCSPHLSPIFIHKLTYKLKQASRFHSELLIRCLGYQRLSSPPRLIHNTVAGTLGHWRDHMPGSPSMMVDVNGTITRGKTTSLVRMVLAIKQCRVRSRINLSLSLSLLFPTFGFTVTKPFSFFPPRSSWRLRAAGGHSDTPRPRKKGFYFPISLILRRRCFPDLIFFHGILNSQTKFLFWLSFLFHLCLFLFFSFSLSLSLFFFSLCLSISSYSRARVK